MHCEIHIGKIILQKLKEKERSITWLAKKVNCDDSNLGRTLRNCDHIHTELLFRISVVLEEDFFACYSEKLKEISKR
ncbi:MAG: XRE family transcriptional regulator [Prevotellaceae bacterium]|jgi:plasmid maintenance system antidote protein VapI|nr:XRE family transcriptional regulator [Prevotellaceae bacterium]